VKKQNSSLPFSCNVLVGENKLDLKDKLTQTAIDIKNPFTHIKAWVQGELMELNSLL